LGITIGTIYEELGMQDAIYVLGAVMSVLTGWRGRAWSSSEADSKGTNECSNAKKVWLRGAVGHQGAA
jgi:hypothetical protein